MYKRQNLATQVFVSALPGAVNQSFVAGIVVAARTPSLKSCLLYTSDAADERSSVDLGGRRILKKQNSKTFERHPYVTRDSQSTSV